MNRKSSTGCCTRRGAARGAAATHASTRASWRRDAGRPRRLVEHLACGTAIHSHEGSAGRCRPAGRLDRVRIARFTTGDDPQFGVVTGDVDELGSPPRTVVVALAGDPLYVGVQLTDKEVRSRRRAAAGAGAAAQQGGRHRPQLRRPRRRDGRRRARRAADVPQAEHLAWSAPATRSSTRASRERALRGRARRRDRPDLPRRPRRSGRPTSSSATPSPTTSPRATCRRTTGSSPAPRASTRSARSAPGSRPSSTPGRPDGCTTHLNGDARCRTARTRT